MHQSMFTKDYTYKLFLTNDVIACIIFFILLPGNLMKDSYLIDIGLEAHVELATRTRMFCGYAVLDPTMAQPNSSVCPAYMGLPGALPVIDGKVVGYVVT